MLKVFPLLFSLLLLGIYSCGNTESSTSTEETMSEETTTEAANFGGIALYTLRDTLAGDPKAVLKEVADLGYAYVEAAGYTDGQFYGMEPVEFNNYLAEIGLQPKSAHMGVDDLESVDQMIADAIAAGFEYFVLPIPPMGAFDHDKETRKMIMTQDVVTVMANINAIAAKCAAAGIKCLYHNHDFEFVADENGVVPVEYFLENSDPNILNFQMDLYWVTKAGADPLAYFDKYPGRFKGWHVKDMDEQGRFAPVGEGTIDFGRVLANKETSGMEFYLVEQDRTFNQDPMEAVAISHGALKEIGFE